MKPVRFSLTSAVLLFCMFGPIIGIGLLSLAPTSGGEYFQGVSNFNGRWWIALLADSSWHRAVLGSLAVAVICCSLALVTVLPAVARGYLRESRAAMYLLYLTAIPLALPPVVNAVALYAPYVRLGLFDTFTGLAISHSMLAVPIFGLALLARFTAGGVTSFIAARSLGAGFLVASCTWLSATHKTTVVYALLLAMLASLTEASLTLFLTDTKVYTVVRRALSGLTQNFDPSAYAVAFLWFSLAFAIYVSFSKWR